MNPNDTIGTNRAGLSAARRYNQSTEETQAMTVPQHTPGPWTESNGPIGFPILYTTDEGDFATLEQTPANARLIAAAPDLLTALQACLAALPYGNESIDLMARAAIAKATAGTPTA